MGSTLLDPHRLAPPLMVDSAAAWTNPAWMNTVSLKQMDDRRFSDEPIERLVNPLNPLVVIRIRSRRSIRLT
ncbi:MAG: hypothetical protein AB7I50_24095 [Vicinamibacterales bacterium]